MEITPFHDYSDALIPLPSLPLDGSASRPESDTSGISSFLDILGQNLNPTVMDQLGPDVTSTGTTEPADPLSTQLPSDGTLLAGNGYSEEDLGGLLEACRDVEGYLLSILLNDLGESFAGSNLFSQTYESSFYKDMFFMELARVIGNQPPGLGIADALYRDISMKYGNELDQLI
jgi:hypothetical protein